MTTSKRLLSALALLASVLACSSSPTPGAIETIRLVDVFDPTMVSGTPAVTDVPEPTEWRFEDADAIDDVDALMDVGNLRIQDGLLVGRATGKKPTLHFVRTTGVDNDDQLHAIEIRARVSDGANLAVETSGSAEVGPEQLGAMRSFEKWMQTPLLAGDEMQTYTIRSPNPRSSRSVRHIFIQPSDVSNASFAIESVRVIFRKEYLAGIEAGVSFQGMSEIYKEALVSRAPEIIEVSLELPSRPKLEIGMGTVDALPVTFQVAIGDDVVLHRTVTTPYRWESTVIDLGAYGGQSAKLELSLSAQESGAIGVWGAPVVRQAGGIPPATAPRGVIILWADTLRRDHLDVYGYERETAPAIARMASEGALFHNNVSQASWTKVSTPSLMTSLYPTTHGVTDFPDHLPASATTLAEVYRAAGYATVSYASNLFTGQFTNLHQGYEELHEDGSLPERGSSKTSRAYADRFTAWLDDHADVPFFAFLHLYDPHDPFEPRPPYDALWADPGHKEAHEADLAKAREVIREPLAKAFGMPSRSELIEAGIDPDAYVGFDKDWYDGSIRGMDVEIARIFECLRALGIDDSTLVVLAADHGEEFLEHGRTFHGQSVYGELVRVPLVLRWPAGIPPGTEIDAMTRTIDVMPTLVELSGLEAPDGIQGRSLAPLLSDDGSAWTEEPAISEKAITTSGQGAPWPEHTEAFSIIDGSWKLIHNTVPDAGKAEYELFDVTTDPFDQKNVAAEHPDVVQRLSEALDGWRQMAAEARLQSDSESLEGLSQQQLERLRSLGYIR